MALFLTVCCKFQTIVCSAIAVHCTLYSYWPAHSVPAIIDQGFWSEGLAPLCSLNPKLNCAGVQATDYWPTLSVPAIIRVCEVSIRPCFLYNHGSNLQPNSQCLNIFLQHDLTRLFREFDVFREVDKNTISINQSSCGRRLWWRSSRRWRTLSCPSNVCALPNILSGLA